MKGCCDWYACDCAERESAELAYDERNIWFGGSLISQRELDEIGDALYEAMEEIAA